MAFLIVGEDPLVARTYTHQLSPLVTTRVANSRASALELLDAYADWVGFLVDLELGEDRQGGLEILQAARLRYPDAQAFLMTASVTGPAVNSAFSLGAQCISKPFEPETLVRCARLATGPREATQCIVDEMRQRCSLSAREAEVLIAAVWGDGRDVFCARSGIAVGTYKNHVASILKKTGHGGFSEVVADVLRSALAARRKSDPPSA